MNEVVRWARHAVAAGVAPADALATLAAALGAPWSGPGRVVPLFVPAGDAWVLDAAREALLAAADPAARRRLGAHHTPPAVARRLAAIALDGLGPGATVLDPACGGGAFLLAAAEVLAAAGADPAHVVAHQLHGIDVDPLAAATAAAALALWAGLDHPAPHVVTGDALAAGRSVDVVLGNPPFLSPLRVDGNPGTGGYTDLAARFLAGAPRWTRPGGRVVLIQPESVLAARDAAPVRAAVLEAATLEGLWVAGEQVFGAAVRVCAPVLRAGAPQPAEVRRWVGADVREVEPALFDPAAATWAPLRPTTAPPPPALPPGTPTIADLATATAGFRDEFYALAAAAHEQHGPDDPRPRLVTSGLIDPGRLLWGERTARIAGRTFHRPVVDLDALPARTRAWVDARLVPKVLVATQTRRIEAVADPDGTLVPLTPVVVVTPHDPADLDRIAAALHAPGATAWARHHFGGTALSADAVKLSARQVLQVPVPDANLLAWWTPQPPS